MKCGNGHDHRTVAEVRACYGVKTPSYTTEGQSEAWRDLPPKDRQMETLRRLREQTGQPARFTGEITRGQASDEIGELIELTRQKQLEVGHGSGVESGPVQPARRGNPDLMDWSDIPAGYYATPSLTGNNDLDFWHVERPTEGRWSGYTFVRRVIGGHADQAIPRDSKKKVKSERIDKVTQFAALEAIRKAGPAEANELFGTELKFCRACGIHLTDETSRALGIGPVCRGR